jgi:hypothetical protein
MKRMREERPRPAGFVGPALPPPAPEPPEYILGLDLGQSTDYSALAILEKTWRPVPSEGSKEEETHYVLRHLQRWPLKTPYTAIVAEVSKMVQNPPLDKPILAVDQTGVGAAVIDQFKQAKIKATLTPILITSGHKVTQDGRVWHVPKKELVSVVQVVLQARRLQFAAVPERERLVKEILAFRVKITMAGNETFEAWRERDHDDMVLAVAMAVWIGERARRKFMIYP